MEKDDKEWVSEPKIVPADAPCWVEHTEAMQKYLEERAKEDKKRSYPAPATRPGL